MGELSSAGALLCDVTAMGLRGVWRGGLLLRRLARGAWRGAAAELAGVWGADAELPGPRRYFSSSLSQVRSEMT